jgi:hypothetical protein
MEQCGTKPKEEEVLDVALAGLHARHSVLRTVLESDSGATMATALPRLMKEEQSVWGQHEEEVAMYAWHGARGEGVSIEEGTREGEARPPLGSVFINTNFLHRGEGKEEGVPGEEGQ